MVRAYLRFDLKVWSNDANAYLASCAFDAVGALDRLEGVAKLADLFVLGLAHRGAPHLEVRRRFGRVLGGAETRECIRRYLKHSKWASKHHISYRALEDVSVVEWDVVERGNPWVLVPVLMESEFRPLQMDMDDALDACKELAMDILDQETLDDERTHIQFQTAALYVWVVAYLQTRADQYRVSVSQVLCAFSKSRFVDAIPWRDAELEAFDPSLGLVREHALCPIEEPPSLSESFAEASQRFKKRKLRLCEWRAYRRLMNNLVFTATPEEEYRDVRKARDFVVLREAWLAEQELPALLDAVQRSELAARALLETARLLECEGAEESSSSSDDDSTVDGSGREPTHGGADGVEQVCSGQPQPREEQDDA